LILKLDMCQAVKLFVNNTISSLHQQKRKVISEAKMTDHEKLISILISTFMYLFTKEVHNFNQTVKQSNLLNDRS